MKNSIVFYSCLFLLISVLSCQKKDLDLELVEGACKNFKISSNIAPSWISDPTCGGTSVNASFQVTFKYTGEASCIHQIDLSPRFYRADNSNIINVSYTGTLMKSDADVTIGSNTATFIFRFTLASTADADALNHVLLKFNTENELGSESNKLEVRINSTCFAVVPGTSYTIENTTVVSSSTVNVTLYDDAAEDGDIVSVYLNGVWVLENYTLKKAGESFNFSINSGNNHLVLFAVNEGSSGPNTAAISINGGSQISLSPDLLTGEAVNIQF